MSDVPEFDEQDQAEVFDEDIMGDEGIGPSAEMRTFEELPDVYDVTTARGDADVDGLVEARDADEVTDEDLDEIGGAVGYDEDEDDDDRLDDALEDEPELSDLDDEDDLDEVDGIDDAEEDEAELEYVGDVEATTSNAGRTATRFESRGELSNEDLEELGYQDGKDEA